MYIQPKIRNLIPDFIIIDSLRGVSILEVKDWSIGYLASWTHTEIKNINGEKLENPVFKAGQYYTSLKGLFSMDDQLFNDHGELDINVASFAVLPNLKQLDFDENGLEDVFTQKLAQYILSEGFINLEIIDLFPQIQPIHEKYLNRIRTILFPEIKILSSNEKNVNELINALDAEQERFAKNISYGHYMITGVPGSGKTVMLFTRAIHLMRENPDWKIRILSYNTSLANKLQQKFDDLAFDLEFMGIKSKNIQISTFHKFACDVAKVGDKFNNNDEKQKWWNEDLPRLALPNATPIYDAILIDEYQDFLDDWIRLAVKSCKRFEILDSKKEKKESINLFLAGDRLQSIYRSTNTPWTEIDPILDMRGRSKLLKKAYRSANEHIHLALQFLSTDPKLKEEVEKFYCPLQEIEYENQAKNSIEMIEGNYENVISKIEELTQKSGYSHRDIMIIYKDFKRLKAFNDAIPSHLKSVIEKCITTTYQSSKGLEAPIVFLLDTDKFVTTDVKKEELTYRKILYVGITRASEKLYIHGENFDTDSYGKDVKELFGSTSLVLQT